MDVVLDSPWLQQDGTSFHRIYTIIDRAKLTDRVKGELALGKRFHDDFLEFFL